MCQTMSMSEKSKNMRNRRVSQESLRCDSLVSDGLGRRMRDHLSARAEMSAWS